MGLEIADGGHPLVLVAPVAALDYIAEALPTRLERDVLRQRAGRRRHGKPDLIRSRYSTETTGSGPRR